MFRQLLTPVADSLALSFICATLPIITVFALLGFFRRPAWQASLGGLIVAVVIAVGLWQFPVNLAFAAIANGATFALWPVMWIVVTALWLYNITVRTGNFDQFKAWMVSHLPNDRRVVLVVVGFSFGALLEGVSGFGTPVAITSSLLVALGFNAIDALTYTLIFNTAPVAFGALGVPITVLGTVTGISDVTLGAMVGRQLPFFGFILPFYAIAFYAGWRAMLKIWPMLFVAASSFAVTQFVVSNYGNYRLTDVLSSLVSLIVTVTFLKIWKLPHDPAFALANTTIAVTAKGSTARGWIPWVLLSVLVIVWTVAKVPTIGAVAVQWPGLHNQVFITLYNTAYAAIWAFQPLATGTAILLAGILTALILRASMADARGAAADTWRMTRMAILTVATIVGLAYLMNYSGLNYTLGLGASSVGVLFPLLSAFLGWVAVFLSGSDTSGNALFGNLQVVAANQLNLNPVLMAATNSSGGVMGKMISPQNISTGVATTHLRSKEGEVFARTFKHSIALTLVLSVIVYLQQYVFPSMIPAP
jgi:lactate permease